MPDINIQYPGKDLEAMSFAANYHQWIVDEFAPYLGNSVVEVGAGRGDLSRLLVQKGLKHLWAFEPSSNLFPLLKASLNKFQDVTIINDFFSPKHVPEIVDSVTYINVLEHIKDDRGELHKAYRMLNQGGHLLIFVPALNWLFSEADKSVGHFRRYHKKPLCELIQGVGFEVEKIRYFDLAGIIPWYLNFVLLENTFNNNSVALYDRVVVPPMRLLERVISPPIGKNLLVVARKA